MKIVPYFYKNPLALSLSKGVSQYGTGSVMALCRCGPNAERAMLV